MLSFKCLDVGSDCDYVVMEDNDTEIMKKVMEHGKRDHNLNSNDLTPSLIDNIRSKMQKVEDNWENTHELLIYEF